MAISTITWGATYELARNMGAKKMQVEPQFQVLICQYVMSRMYTYHPWKFSLTNSIDLIPLVNGLQDYPAPPDIYRLTQAWIHVVYPGSVDQNYNIDVVWNLTPDLNPTGFYGNGSVLFIQKTNLLRLANASQVVNAPSPAYLNVEYQPQPPKITDLTQYLPFPDEYAQIAVEGILYWLYKFGDDDRAGVMVKQGASVEYTGQQAVFEGQLQEMAGAEMVGAGDTIFPADTMGQRWYGERPPLGPWW